MLITTEQHGAVRRLTLNRPEVRNAISLDVVWLLTEAMQAAANDESTSVVLLSGAGKGFSAGYDLVNRDYKGGDILQDRNRLRQLTSGLEAVWECPLPVIAQVHGFALAGGADLALHCDFLMCADDSRIGYPPTRNLGTPPSNIWLYRLGAMWAKRLLLSGDSLTGRQAVSLGLALESHPADSLPDKAMDLAQRLAQCSRASLIANKWVVNRGVDLMGRSMLNAVARTEDAIAHVSPEADAFRSSAADLGLAKAVRMRDEPFQPDPGSVTVQV